MQPKYCMDFEEWALQTFDDLERDYVSCQQQEIESDWSPGFVEAYESDDDGDDDAYIPRGFVRKLFKSDDNPKANPIPTIWNNFASDDKDDNSRDRIIGFKPCEEFPDFVEIIYE